MLVVGLVFPKLPIFAKPPQTERQRKQHHGCDSGIGFYLQPIEPRDDFRGSIELIWSSGRTLAGVTIQLGDTVLADVV